MKEECKQDIFQLLDLMNEFFIILNRENLILYMNKAALSLYNWKNSHVINRSFSELQISHPLLCPLPPTIDIQGGSFLEGIETFQAKPLKNIVWKVGTFNLKNISGLLILIGEDITALHQLDEKVYELDTIIAQVPGNLYWYSKDLIYLGCNENSAISLGMKREETVGKNFIELMGRVKSTDEHLVNVFVEQGKEVIRTGQPLLDIEEPPFYGSGNKLSYYLANKVPLYNKRGEIYGVIGISVDITDLKKMEKDLRRAKEAAEAANRAKSAFIANMSHDIRTPLTGVIGISELLENEGDSMKDRDYAHIIHESSEKLLSLLNDILEIISADEIKEEKLRNETFSLRERINQIAEIFRPNAELKHLKLETSIDPYLPEYVISDRIKLDRILLNLVSNALKFTHQGKIKLIVSLSSEANTKGWVQFTVSDTGTGIPDDKIHHIFDRFFRITPAYEGKYEGFGIGLFLVKRFVELLGGEITVDSQLEKGTVFKVFLPLQAGKIEEATQCKPIDSAHIKKVSVKYDCTQKIQPTDKTSVQQQKKVLLIEDDAIARQVARNTLQRAELEVEETDNAEVGFKQVMENHYDLIVTDIGLPGMNGNQFASLVRSWENITHQARVPIIGLTAHGGNKAQESLQAGMDELLAKPMSSQKIEEIKQKFLYKIGANQSHTQEASQEAPIGLGLDLPLTEKELFELESYPLLDEEEGVTNAGGDPAFLKDLLVMLVNQSIPDESALLKEAHNISDWEEVRRIAHKLKGAAVYCGTTRMKYACQYMERYVLAGHTKLCEKLYEQLMQVLKETYRHVESYLLQ